MKTPWEQEHFTFVLKGWPTKSNVCVCVCACVGQESHRNYHIFTVVCRQACRQANTPRLSELCVKPVVFVTSLCPLLFYVRKPSVSSFTPQQRWRVETCSRASELQACPGEWAANVSQHWILLLGKHWRVSPWHQTGGFRLCSETDLWPLVSVKSILLQAVLQMHLILREAEKATLKSLNVSVCNVYIFENGILYIVLYKKYYGVCVQCTVCMFLGGCAWNMIYTNIYMNYGFIYFF